MMYRDTRMVSQATGEDIPEWLALEEDAVVEGVGNIIVREEDDGTWSVVRQVDGAMPEVDSGHPTQEIAMRLARAYNEGGRILVERRISKEIVAAGIRKGMVAKYGGNSVVVIGVDGNDIQVLSPGGEDRYVDISELTEVHEVQDPEADPDYYFGDEVSLEETPAGMMAGEEHLEEEEEGIKSPEEEALLEELEELEESEEEEELSGLMVGPPVYFAEIEPTPGLRQSPLGASKTAAVHISQEKGERPDLRIKPSEMLDLYASIGIPLTKEAHHVKIGEVFLVYDEGSGTFRLEDEIINGSVTPMTSEMTEVEAPGVLQNHTDLPEAAVAAVLVGAKENGSISIGDRLGYLVQAELLLEPAAEGLMVITDDGMAVTEPMDSKAAFDTLMDSTSLPYENIMKAVEMVSAGETLVIANVRISKEAPVCKKCNQRHWPFQPCPGTKPEKEKSPEKAEEKAEDKEARRVTAQPPGVGMGPLGPTDDTMSGFIPGEPGPAAATEFRTDLAGNLVGYTETDSGRQVTTVDGRWLYEDTGEPAPSPEQSGLSASKAAGRVRMYFDWDEFYSNVMPQLSNGQFQSAFAEIASSSPEDTASQEEKDLYDEELLLLGRESSRRKLPDVSKLRFGIRSIVALEKEPDVEGEVIEYRGSDDDVDYLLNMLTGHQIWFKDGELKPTSNPDTTTVPWPERTKKIVDPENKRQDKEFKEDLNRKVGQGVDAYLYDDSDLEYAAIAAVEEAIPKETITAAAEHLGADEDPFDAAYNLVEDHKDALLVSGRKFLPYMAEESRDEEAFMHYARNVVTWDLPNPRGAHYDEAMKLGTIAKLKADYETENTELQQLRDNGSVGRIVDLNEKDAAIAFGDSVLLIGQSGLEVVGNFFRECTIRRCRPGDRDSKKPASDQVWCLYAKSTDKVLGRHPSREEALDQEKAIKAQGGLRTAENGKFVDDICPDFVEKSLKDEQKGAKEYSEMAKEMPSGSPKQKALENMAKDEESHADTLEKWKKGTEASVTREAPGPPFGGEPGTTAEPAPKGKQISAPPGAPSKGRERPPSPAEFCICPVSGKEFTKQAGVPCSSMENPEHPGVKLVDKPQGPPSSSPGKKPTAAAVETEARYTLGQFLGEYAKCVIRRVQSGVLTPAAARKEINETAKEWGWSAAEKKYMKQLLDGKNPAPPENWAVASARPFDSGRTPAQDSVSGGGVKVRDIRTAQSDIATLLKDLDRGEAQSVIRSLDESIDVSNALEGLGWGDDTNDLRQWLIESPGMTEDTLRTYAGDPEPANRLVALRAMAERFPQADVSAWLQDDFPFIAEKANELASGVPFEEVLPSPTPQIPQIPFVPESTPESAPQAGAAKRLASDPPGSSPPEFPEHPEPPTDLTDKKPARRKSEASTPAQLVLTHDTPNEQYVLYNMDFGLVSPVGADEKIIKGQLKAYGIDDERISEALKEAKDNIVHIVASKREAQQGVERFILDAVQGAINELSPEAPRANITMAAMDKFAELTADLGLDPRTFQDELKNAIDAELSYYSRPEVPGTKLEFMQIAKPKTGRTYEGEEKKRRINDLAKHGIPLRETFEKEPPEDIPPGRRLSTGESRNGFTVGDRVRDLAVPEFTGIIEGFGIGNTIRVAMNSSDYCTEGSIGLYLPDGLEIRGISDA